MNFHLLLKELNFLHECRKLRWGIWQCPPFLVIANGCITIAAMIGTYLLASRFVEEPEIAALIVMGVAAFLIIIGSLMVKGFNEIAEAHRIKSEFITIVSHQLRSPLSIFKWTVDLLNRISKKEELSQRHEWENSITTLHNTAENMIRLVNLLIEVSRIESATAIFRKKALSLPAETEKILRDFQSYARAFRITVAFRPDASLPSVEGDEERVAIVIHNLIDNAIRYTAGGGQIVIRIARKGSFLAWSITDQGMGIPEDQKAFIFQKFFRAGNVVDKQTRGSGIGLYTVKAITEAMGGAVGFESQEGKGSMFWFTLPIARDQSNQ